MNNASVLNEDQISKYHQLEDMAAMLDKHALSNMPFDEEITKAQLHLNKLAEALTNNKTPNQRNYIIYENQAILHLINGNKNEAIDFIKIAIKTKGDSGLFTTTGNKLAYENGIGSVVKAPKANSLSGISGWLAVFMVILILTVARGYYSSITGFLDSSMYASSAAYYPGLIGLINFENLIQLAIAIFGTYLCVHLFKYKKSSIKLMKGFLFAVFIYSILDILAAYLIFYGDKVILDGLFNDSSLFSGITFSIIWFCYFTYSKRVQATFVKE